MTIEKVLEKYREAEKIRPAFERVTLFSWNDMLLLKSEIEKARVLLSTRVEASRLDTAMDKIEKLRSALRYQIMTYQVDDQAFDREADADSIMARVLNDA